MSAPASLAKLHHLCVEVAELTNTAMYARYPGQLTSALDGLDGLTAQLGYVLQEFRQELRMRAHTQEVPS